MTTDTTALPLTSTRDGVGHGLVQLGASNERVVVLSADLADSTRAAWFAERYPDRFFEVGVAEANLAGLAAGMALRGFIPYILSYAVFSPGLNWGVIRSSIAYSNLPVKIIGGHAGLSTGPDGATHQALEDIALMRVLPNMTVVAPSSATEALQATVAVADTAGPTYIRVSKFESEFTATHHSSSPFSLGHASVEREGNDVAIITCGPMLEVAIHAADQLTQEAISTRIINLSTIKPLDGYTVLKAFGECSVIISLEDHQVAGGMGSAIAEVLSAQGFHKPFAILGVDDRFGQSGTASELFTAYGLNATRVVHTVKQLLSKPHTLY